MSTKQRIAAALQNRFGNNQTALNHFLDLLLQYAESGLSPPHLVPEIETGEEGKLWSYIWEAMLYRHLRSNDYRMRSLVSVAGQNGPDFGIDYQGRTIWIEAIVPSPEGISADWLEPLRSGECRGWTKPDQERVLRCTSAIHAKQKKFAEYLAKEIVGPSDCLVIAVNICRLSDLDVDENGISQLPLVMEAVFPIGPVGVPITQGGELDGPAQHVPRFSVTKVNGSEIQTGNFLNPLFSNVSAVMQGHQRHMIGNDLAGADSAGCVTMPAGHQRHMIGNDLALSMVHNPLASNPLSTGLFGVYKEFVAEERGDEYMIKDVAMKG
jgi:hypothetical protein